jgi:hypothetical protein
MPIINGKYGFSKCSIICFLQKRHFCNNNVHRGILFWLWMKYFCVFSYNSLVIIHKWQCSNCFIVLLSKKRMYIIKGNIKNWFSAYLLKTSLWRWWLLRWPCFMESEYSFTNVHNCLTLYPILRQMNPSIHSTSSHPVSSRSILILFSRLYLHLPSGILR